jgi:hypothetical protein
MYVYLLSGRIDVVPSVVRTSKVDNRLVLYDAHGAVVAGYPLRTVYLATDVLISPPG